LERQIGMAELEAAEQHLGVALERLQAALNRRLTRMGSAPLTGEQVDLADEVIALRDECQTLREVTGHVARRLDSSVDELDRLIGG
jgi:hypothetical protein